MTLIVPEKAVGDPGKSYIFMWIVPARVAGRWESQLALGGRPTPVELRLEQNFQLIHGTARVGDREVKLPQFRMAGEQISFNLPLPAGKGEAVHRFRGVVKGEAIEGNVTVGDGAAQRTLAWSAKRTVRAEPNMGAAQ
jgi:hypothetical protein